MPWSERGLLDLKEKIGESKTKIAELQGQRKMLNERLKSEWSCDSVKEARTHLKRMEQTKEEIEDKIDDGLEKIEEIRNG